MEEQRVIEDANKRMAEVHAKKAVMASNAAKAIEKTKEETLRKVDALKSEEKSLIDKLITFNAASVVSK